MFEDIKKFSPSSNTKTVEELLREFFFHYLTYDFSRIMQPSLSSSIPVADFVPDKDSEDKFEELPSSLSHLRYRTPSLRCKESQRAQYCSVARLSRANSCQDDQSAEFSFFSRIGLIAGSSSCTFWILHEDQGSADVVIETFTAVSVSIPNFFSALEQCLQLSLQGLRESASSFP
ncbi:hypothetical protein AVEN_68398-1 [Araneus ventricosus]|uniref:Uncharacterized protein n=1 Tax=Araneus ventricosus TaxID=182803 RepID=A0A4Y2D0Y4_ARAVE|nr:hypothetical protein AVEN_68398-1 [Araneus ventricosus]